MATINILVIVDVRGANTRGQGGLANNVWMLDSGKYSGTREGGNELITNLNAGDQIVWSLAAIDPGTNLVFPSNTPSFAGPAVQAHIINPKQNPVDPGQHLATFEVPAGTAAGTRYRYSMVLSMGGVTQLFDPFLSLWTST
jgi:hypothetical protein